MTATNRSRLLSVTVQDMSKLNRKIILNFQTNKHRKKTINAHINLPLGCVSSATQINEEQKYRATHASF